MFIAPHVPRRLMSRAQVTKTPPVRVCPSPRRLICLDYTLIQIRSLCFNSTLPQAAVLHRRYYHIDTSSTSLTLTMAPGRAEKPIFRDLTIAVAGDLGGQWTDTNIQRWVALRAGKFAQEIDASVTHLVCSHDEFKKKGSRGMSTSPSSPQRVARVRGAVWV